MKKPKRSMGFDERPDPSSEVSLDLDTGGDDDEIIELEDIIEMPADYIDEDEDLDMDVDILDAELGADFGEPGKQDREKAAQPPPAKAQTPSAVPAAMDDDLGDFELDDDEADLFEKLVEEEAAKKPAPKEEAAFSDEDDLLLRSLLDEAEPVPEPKTPRENQLELVERAVAALKVEDETDRVLAPEAVPAPETASAPEAPAPEKAAAAAPQPARAPVPEDESLVPELVEELVGRIESRLLETVRLIVEARLPDVAREIIREEIERLKKEIQ